MVQLFIASLAKLNSLYSYSIVHNNNGHSEWVIYGMEYCMHCCTMYPVAAHIDVSSTFTLELYLGPLKYMHISPLVQ